MQKVTPFLWFGHRLGDALEFYQTVFADMTVDYVQQSSDGTVLMAAFTLHGQSFRALNGGPEFTFNEAVSFMIDCENQEEVDYYWSKLTKEGQPGQCGWLKDKFGLSWQVTPRQLGELLSNPDAEAAGRVMQAMLSMGKIDIEALQAAASR